jgi:hypothetical protein
LNTNDYRNAPGGDGPEAANWADKPHRLVYDLCAEIERLNGKLPLSGPTGWQAGPFHFRLADCADGILVSVEIQVIGGRGWITDKTFPRNTPRRDILAAMNQWAREVLQTWMSQLPGEHNEA